MMRKKREKQYRELAGRLSRQEKLDKIKLEMDMQKQIMGKGSERKVGKDEIGNDVWRWKMQRKR